MLLPITFTASHALNVLEDVWGQGLVSIAVLSKAAMLINLLPDISILAITVFQISKFEPSVSFLVATIAVKFMKCVSFPNLVLSTLMVLMNVLPTFSFIISALYFSPYSLDLYLIFCALVLKFALRYSFSPYYFMSLLYSVLMWFTYLFTFCFAQIHLIGLFFAYIFINIYIYIIQNIIMTWSNKD